ncbi:dipicolinate synthase subunit B [Youxingia wuxianensis]|uniref:Dipicolinate synthase subunit B n=1 Tax=Youxingia wuxianensis TaxID=2763678 RepID=A0A926EPS8_9FIRM|nr:dipicolinate synthase subunit B [Youxingia wuxianensis]MBC8584124.1 dipicolinate synthase subunit B [Youxingia wuxianensis]
MEKIKVGFAMTGSFCTWDKVVPVLKELTKTYDITPMMSAFSYSADTRFGDCAYWNKQVEEICGKSIIHTIQQAEPVGPKNLFDVMVIAPCTGNTIGKLANAITDTPVTMAAKANLRNDNPLILAVSTNDALSGSAKNIGLLMNTKNIYFVPMRQDDYRNKPNSLVADFLQIGPTIEEALQGKQIQPIYC